MSKGSPTPPPAPDPNVIAGAQTKSNVDTSLVQGAENRVNQYTPYGSTVYNQTGTVDVNGHPVPQFSQTTSLNPLVQAMLSGTEEAGYSMIPALKQLSTQAGTAATNPLNFSGANEDYLSGGPQPIVDAASRAAYGEAKGFLDPRFDQQHRDLEDQLSRQGIPLGSEAYNRATTNFETDRNQAYKEASDAAIGQGFNAAPNLFGMALQGQQQNIAQQKTAQQRPLDLLSAMLSGQGGTA